MIKKIHYFWFGKNPKPDAVINCKKSWEKYCPDFEIIEWNEDNFDFSDCEFARDAYAARKWAFISDYARAKVLYKEGGVVLDTDVELLKPLDDDLLSSTFFGFEDDRNVNPGLIMYANVPMVDFFREAIELYKSIKFDCDNLGNITSPILYSKLLVAHGVKLNGQKQSVDGITIYPKEYFNPIGLGLDKNARITDNSYSIHHYDASWISDDDRELFLLRKTKGEKKGRFIYTLKHPIKAFKRFINSHKNKKAK